MNKNIKKADCKYCKFICKNHTENRNGDCVFYVESENKYVQQSKRIEELEKELEKYKPKNSPVCESCPSFQGRAEYCMMGLSIGEGDFRTCSDYGLINQKELLIERGIYETIKKYWRKTEINYIKRIDVERVIDDILDNDYQSCGYSIRFKKLIKSALKGV